LRTGPRERRASTPFIIRIGTEDDVDTCAGLVAAIGAGEAEAWRRRGIGEALTAARMAWVARRADRLYYITGHENLASQVLHQRLGFRELPGTWIPPGGQPRDARSQQFCYADLSRPGEYRP
jgi:GNAT superfamily N-acetyltransferase